MEQGADGSDNKSKRTQEEAGMGTEDRREAPEKSPSQMLSPNSGETGPDIAKGMCVNEDIGQFDAVEMASANPTDNKAQNFL